MVKTSPPCPLPEDAKVMAHPWLARICKKVKNISKNHATWHIPSSLQEMTRKQDGTSHRPSLKSTLPLPMPCYTEIRCAKTRKKSHTQSASQEYHVIPPATPPFQDKRQLCSSHPDPQFLAKSPLFQCPGETNLCHMETYLKVGCSWWEMIEMWEIWGWMVHCCLRSDFFPRGPWRRSKLTHGSCTYNSLQWIPWRTPVLGPHPWPWNWSKHFDQFIPSRTISPGC